MIRDFGGIYLGKRNPDPQSPAPEDEYIKTQSSQSEPEEDKFLHSFTMLKRPPPKDDFLIREDEEMSIDQFVSKKWIVSEDQNLESFQRYIEPLKAKASIRRQISLPSKDASVSTMSTQKANQLSSTKPNDQQEGQKRQVARPTSESITSANFNSVIKKRVSYLQQAYTFLNFYYKDCMKADLDQLSLRSKIPHEVLQFWIDNKHSVVQMMRVLSQRQP